MTKAYVAFGIILRGQLAISWTSSKCISSIYYRSQYHVINRGEAFYDIHDTDASCIIEVTVVATAEDASPNNTLSVAIHVNYKRDYSR